MTEPMILAVDLGTSGMKVALITVSGRVVGWEAEPVRLILTPDGGAEQSPEDWWQARSPQMVLSFLPPHKAHTLGRCRYS